MIDTEIDPKQRRIVERKERMAAKLEAGQTLPWPPELPGGKQPQTIDIDGVEVEFIFFPGQDRPPGPGPWSVWGNGLCVGDHYYTSIGNHESPIGRVLIYDYNLKSRQLNLLTDVTDYLRRNAQKGDQDYLPGKIHGRLDRGRDGWLYYATYYGHAHGSIRTNNFHGDWIMRTHPETGQTEIVCEFPVADHTIPGGFLDPERMLFYGGTVAGPDAEQKICTFFVYDVENRELRKTFQPGFSRCGMLAKSTGRVYWGGGDQGWKYDPETNEVEACGAPGVRSCTPELNGLIYGTSGANCNLWVFDTREEKLSQLSDGRVGRQGYTTAISIDPTEQFLYYAPGGHGGSENEGTPVVRYDIQKKEARPIVKLKDAIEKAFGYIPCGSFGSALSPDGSTLCLTYNGSRSRKYFPALTHWDERRTPTALWDTAAMVVIHLPG